jgi:hypothetical protein
MTFGQIEHLIGGLLPHAAIKRRAWWANDSQQEQARAWLNAGWRVEVVYQDRGLVTFMKLKSRPPESPLPDAFEWSALIQFRMSSVRTKTDA